VHEQQLDDAAVELELAGLAGGSDTVTWQWFRW